ncbi:MAG: ATP-binding protein [Bacteroidales bacterium]|nr:ATP-binding protein [Bacteroidales bacterium]
MKHTQTRIFLFLLILSIISVSIFIVIYIVDRSKQSLQYEYNQARFNEMVDQSMERQMSIIQRIVFDYSYWDDVLNAIDINNSSFFDEQIASVTFPQTGNLSSLSQLDYVWLIKNNHEVVYEYGNEKMHGEKAEIPIGAIYKLRESKFISFTILTSQGYMLVSGATVHPSDDIKRVKPSGGFFFMAKLLNSEFLQEFGQQASATLNIVLPSQVDTLSRSLKLYKSNYPLADYLGKPISFVHFERHLAFASFYTNYTRITFGLILFLIFSMLLGFYLLSRNMLTRPLELVVRALETNDIMDALALKQLKSEFGLIGGLIEKFIHQKQDLIDSQQKAEESDRLKTAFLANMSHEIRTPMNGILGFTELLRDTDINEDQRIEYVEIIQRSGQNLLHIINDIIDISKIEAGQMHLSESELSINDLMNDVYETFRHDQKINQGLIHLELQMQISPENNFIISDRVRLFQILSNFMANAIKFTPKGFINLGCHLLNDNTIEFFVGDSGIGIAEDKRELIFNRFVQVDIGATRSYDGAGLGLSISKALVELLQGNISVRSELGAGSVFSFTIPLKQVDMPNIQIVKDIKKLGHPDYSTKKILVVDDIKENFLFFYHTLNSTGVKMDWAKDGQESVDMVRLNQYDLVLMDLRMPVLNGYDATRIIKNEYPDMVIIAQTAYSLDSDREKSIEIGCNDYISKPIIISSLMELLLKYLT